MKVPRKWTDRLEIQNGHVVRVLTAEWYEERLDVYRENDDGLSQKRNLYRCMYFGWSVAFPGLPMFAHSRKSDPPAYLENWESLPKYMCFGGGLLTDREREMVCEVYPDFKYLLKKFNVERRYELMEILVMWKKHPELELILSAGYVKVGMSEAFWKLSEKKKKEVCRFMRLYPQFKAFKIREILKCLKFNNPELYAEYTLYVLQNKHRYMYEEISFDDFLYLKKLKGIAKDCFDTEIERKISIFCDVLQILERSHHNITDEYWRHPKDLIAIHDRLVAEREAVKKAEKMKELKQLASKLRGIKNKFSEYATSVNGYSIFVSVDYDEWKKQADALHQCIVASGYYEGMANGRYTIVFIQKDGLPQATAQVMPDGKINQFYANEIDRENCLPSLEIKEAFNKWLETVPKSKFKKSKPRQRKSVKKEVAA